MGVTMHCIHERPNRRLNLFSSRVNETPPELHGPNLHGRSVHLFGDERFRPADEITTERMKT